MALRNVVWAELALLMLPVIVVGTDSDSAGVQPRLNQALAVVMAVALVAILAVALARSDRDFESGYPPGVLDAVARTTDNDAAIAVFGDVAFSDWLLWHLPHRVAALRSTPGSSFSRPVDSSAWRER